MAATEARRLKRIDQKNVQTTCFACREKGHAAKDCPSQSGGVEGSAKGAPSVGICYRYDLTLHIHNNEFPIVSLGVTQKSTLCHGVRNQPIPQTHYPMHLALSATERVT